MTGDELRAQERGGDLISRQDALNFSCEITGRHGDEGVIKACFEAYGDHIKRLPSASPTGEWIFNTEENGKSYNVCSVCGDSIFHRQNFCPNCGADMRKEGNMIPIKLSGRYPHSRREDIVDAFLRGRKSARKSGEWEIYDSDKICVYNCRCNKCKAEFFFPRIAVEPYEYCPKCGARMVGDEE